MTLLPRLVAFDSEGKAIAAGCATHVANEATTAVCHLPSEHPDFIDCDVRGMTLSEIRAKWEIPAILHNTLDNIEQSAPVHTLARLLIKAGLTEAQLLEILGERKGSIVGVELQNAFRDLERGFRHVTTRYGRQITV